VSDEKSEIFYTEPSSSYLTRCCPYHFVLSTESDTKVKPSVFVRKCICNSNEIYMDIFCNNEDIFYRVSFIFNMLSPMLSKTLYISAVRFSASTSEHITATLFQFVVICKMASS
jgi:hypothetical protein